MNQPPQALTANLNKKWLPLGVLGLVAVLAGLVLPQMMPSIEPVSPSTPVSATGAAKDAKSDWTYVPPAWPEPPNHRTVFLRLGLGTVSVLALCAGTLWCCKRWLKAGVPAATAGAQLRCLETLALGNRCVVHLVQMGNRSVLIGADAAGIKTIVPLPESFAQTLLAAEEPAA